MTQAQSPLATRPPDALMTPPVISARAMGGEGLAQIVRVEATVTLPAAFQYVIPGGRKKVGDEWITDNKVGITSDGYDYANRTLGVAFWLPERVPDEEGNLVRNPIHRPDYYYIRMGGVWRNEAGQIVGMTEDLEVNYTSIYTNARLEAKGAEVQMNDKGQPLFDEHGLPVIILKDYQDERWEGTGAARGKVPYTVTAAEQEKKALKALYQLRTMGGRYAQTVLRVRILKVALGVKSLPLQQPRDFQLRVVGWQDNMTPDERVRHAQANMSTLFGAPGRPADAQPLTAAEMADIEAADVETSVDRSVLEATGVVEQQPDEPAQDEFAFPAQPNG